MITAAGRLATTEILIQDRSTSPHPNFATWPRHSVPCTASFSQAGLPTLRSAFSQSSQGKQPWCPIPCQGPGGGWAKAFPSAQQTAKLCCLG